MTRPNAVVVAATVALVLAGGAAFLAYTYLKGENGRQARSVSVVTTTADIGIGSKLDPAQLKSAQWPRESLAPGYCSDPRTLAGRVAVRQISAGDVITESKLMPKSAAATGGVMTYIVPQGHRAVTVAVNEVAGVAGFITPNSRVDVVLTTPRPGAADKEQEISKIILQNVPVLASGQVTEQKDGKPSVVPTVTLDLVPEDAERLIVGAKRGALQLLLRNMIDVASIQTAGSTIAKALGAVERPSAPPARPSPREVRTAAPPKVVVAARPAPSKVVVEVITGGRKSTREFAEQ